MKNKGLTLIELVIAVFIIAVGTVGAFSVLQKVIVSTTLSSSRLTASYLAQEGVEIIRNIRDTNWVFVTPSWDDNINVDSSNYLDYQSSAFPDSACVGDYLKFDESLGFYICNPPSDGKFKRTITVVKPEADKMEVTVQVEWKELGGAHSITVQENLYNWYNPGG